MRWAADIIPYRIAKKIALATLLAFVVITACDGDNNRSIEPTPDLDKLKSAPIVVQVVDRNYSLETYLWRDFMPISPPDGKPMIALVHIVEKDSLPIPAGLTADRIWIINGSEIWESEFSEEERPATPPYKLEKIARNGPKWGPGITVDVVVRLRTASGATQLLRATDQNIHRTD